MESFPSHIKANMQGGRQDFVHALLPLLKLITLTVIGLILAHPKTQLVPRTTFKLLSKLVFALFLPCLIFTHLGETITYKNFLQWWFIPFNVILSTAIGCLLGLLVVKICRPQQEFNRFTIIMTAFGNNDNLPLAVVGSVCRSPGNPFGPNCLTNGTAYISFSQCVAVFLVYTLVYNMMKPSMDSDPVFGVDEHGYSDSDDLIRPLLDGEAEDTKRISTAQEPDRPSMSSILHPLTVSTLLACVAGTVPAIKSILYGDDAPLSFITDSFEIMAGAMVPSVMLILGGMLSEGPKESQLGIRTTVGIIIARLLVLPLIGIGVISAADRLRLLIPGDQMYRFVLLLQYTTPSAILLGAVASLRGCGASEASALLFWQHIFAVCSLTAYVLVYFKMLLYYH